MTDILLTVLITVLFIAVCVGVYLTYLLKKVEKDIAETQQQLASCRELLYEVEGKR